MIGQGSAILARSIEHDASKSNSRHSRDQGTIRFKIGEQQTHEADTRKPQATKSFDDSHRVAAGEKPNLDDITAACRHGTHGGGESGWNGGEIADGRADGNRSRQRRANGRHGFDRQGTESAMRWVFAINNARPPAPGREGFVDRGHAGKEGRGYGQAKTCS